MGKLITSFLEDMDGHIMGAEVKVSKSGIDKANKLYPLVPNNMKDDCIVGAKANPKRPDEMSIINILCLRRNAAIFGELC